MSPETETYEKVVNFSVLPPCKVCGDKASGYHYGAITCEACKGFFRRTYTKNIRYICKKGEKKCKIEQARKSSCPYCRYQKCLDIGMDLKAVRRGRYTLEERTKCIEAVKSLEREKDLNDMQDMPAQFPSYDSNNNHKTQFVFVKQEEMESLIKHLTGLHSQYVKDMENAPLITSEFLEERKNMESILAMNGLTFDMELLDGRTSLVKSLLPKLEKSVVRAIQFMKVVPGFTSLTFEDQIALIKVNCFFWRGFHLPEVAQKFISLFGQEMAEMAENLIRIVAILKRLNLTEVELVFLKIICALATDECPLLENRDKVDNLKFKYVETLQYYIEYHHNGSLRRLGQILLILPELRTAYHFMRPIREKLLSRDWFGVDVPPLLVEIISM